MLSIEEKAKRYDEVVEKAKIEKRKKRNLGLLKFIDENFLELKESEDENADEKVRKALIKLVTNYPSMDLFIEYDIHLYEALSWLEKQGKNNMGISEATKQELENNLNKALEKETLESLNEFLDEQKSLDDIAKEVTKNKETAISFLKSAGIINENGELADEYKIEQGEQKPSEEYNITSIGSKHAQGKLGNMIKNLKLVNEVWEQESRGKSALEAVKEEKVDNQNYVKSANRVEPKFKVGDWVVRGKTIAQILDIQEEYYVGIDIEGNDFTSSRFLSDDKIHLWTIEDAKDGDVLYTSSTASNEIFIFKKLDEKGNIKCYCSYDSEDKYCDGKYHFIGKPTFNTRPATKEQRDLLFQKMKEAGYEWDAEKKELKFSMII